MRKWFLVMKRRWILVLPALAILAGCGGTAAAAASTPSVHHTAPPASSAPVANPTPTGPIAEPGLTFSTDQFSYNPDTNQTSFRLTVTNTQPQTIYLSSVAYNEFDASGNLLWKGRFNGSWPVADGSGGYQKAAAVAIRPGTSCAVILSDGSHIASVQVTDAGQSYQP